MVQRHDTIGPKKGIPYDGKLTKATAADIRFTQKDDDLYVAVLAWPADRKVLVRSLAEGLLVQLPATRINHIMPVLRVR